MRIGQVKMLHNSFLFLIFKLFPYIKTPLLLKAGGFLSSEKVGFFTFFLSVFIVVLEEWIFLEILTPLF